MLASEERIRGLIANAMAMTLLGISGSERCIANLLKMQVSILY